MEKNIIFWSIGMVLAISLIFNLGGDNLTANVTKSGTPTTKEPRILVLTPTVEAGSNLKLRVENVGSLSSSRLNILELDGTYTGISFRIPRGDCSFLSPGKYSCISSFNFPHSLIPNGNYLVKVKSDSSGKLVGIGDDFTLKGSSYQTTGR